MMLDLSHEKRRGFVADDTLWAQAFMDTPRSPPPNPKSMDDAFNTPGCHLKSQKFPYRYFGRLVVIDRERDLVAVLVKDRVPKEVWLGTVADYYRDWRCD